MKVIILLSLVVAALSMNSSETDIEVPLLYCATKECGTASGWGEKSKRSWDLDDGDSTIEELPSNVCFIGGVKGFKATVCLVSAYPTLHCLDKSGVYVQKNGSPIGRIEVVPYCSLFRRDED